MTHQSSIQNPSRPQSASSNAEKSHPCDGTPEIDKAQMPANFRQELHAGASQAQEVNKGAQPKRSWWQALSLLPFVYATREEAERQRAAAAQASVKNLSEHEKQLDVSMERLLENLNSLEKRRLKTLDKVVELLRQGGSSEETYEKMKLLAIQYRANRVLIEETLDCYERVESYRAGLSRPPGRWSLKQLEWKKVEFEEVTPVTPKEIEDLIALAISVHEDSRQRSDLIRKCEEEKSGSSAVTDLSVALRRLYGQTM